MYFFFYSCQLVSTVKRNETHVNSFSVLFTCLSVYAFLCVYMYCLFLAGGKKSDLSNYKASSVFH